MGKKQIYFDQQEQNIKSKLQSHQTHYHKMNQFILNITQSQFKLPRNVLSIIGKTQRELILHHHKFQSDIMKSFKMIRERRKSEGIQRSSFCIPVFSQNMSKTANQLS